MNSFKAKDALFIEQELIACLNRAKHLSVTLASYGHQFDVGSGSVINLLEECSVIVSSARRVPVKDEITRLRMENKLLSQQHKEWMGIACADCKEKVISHTIGKDLEVIVEDLTPQLSGDIPLCRNTFALCLHNNFAYMHGGKTGRNPRVLVDEVYRLDLERLRWQKLNPDESEVPRPSARWGHMGAIIKDKMYLYGGHDGSQVLADLHILDVQTPDQEKWLKCPSQSNAPLRQFGSSSVVKDVLYIIGGGDGHIYFNDVWTLDPSVATRLTRLETAGQPPIGRLQHCASVLGSKIYIYGGEPNSTQQLNDIFLLDTETRTWHQPQVEGRVPAPRLALGSGVFGDFLLFYGGYSMGQWIDDIMCFNTPTSTWTKPLKIQGQSAGTRARYRPVQYKGALYITGGNNDKQSFDDLKRIRLLPWPTRRSFLLVRLKGDSASLLARLPEPLFRQIVTFA